MSDQYDKICAGLAAKYKEPTIVTWEELAACCDNEQLKDCLLDPQTVQRAPIWALLIAVVEDELPHNLEELGTHLSGWDYGDPPHNPLISMDAIEGSPRRYFTDEGLVFVPGAGVYLITTHPDAAAAYTMHLETLVG